MLNSCQCVIALQALYKKTYFTTASSAVVSAYTTKAKVD